MIGTILDHKYELVRLLGEGGMGAVYEAVQTGTGRRVAVKVISVHLLMKKDTETVRRFHREATAAAAVQSPHIAQLLDVGTEPETGAPYLVMEYLHGQDLDQLIQRTGPLPPDLVMRIAAQACMGLQKAHEARVVHRDIKPANLFLAANDAGEVIVKIVDFGVAKIRSEDGQGAAASGLTRTGAMVGSPLYMSPEQARGSKELDARTDIWSLGITLYRALSGHTPHESISGFGELVMALCSKPPLPIQELAPWVPKEIAQVIHNALQFEPEQRYSSAAVMLDDIQPLLAGGFDLHTEALVGLGATERAVVAPRLDLPPSSVPEGADSEPRHVVRASLTDASISATDATVATMSGRQRSRIAVGVWVAVAAALGAAGVYLLAAPPAAAPIVARKFAIATRTALPAAAPVNSAPQAAQSPGDLRRVKLAIAPGDASVEIDGTMASLQDGGVELAGELGSIHRVRVFKGKSELVQEVVVSAEGAVPAKLSLKADMKLASPPKASSAAAPVETPQPKPAASTVAPRPPPTAEKNPLVPDSFQ